MSVLSGSEPSDRITPSAESGPGSSSVIPRTQEPNLGILNEVPMSARLTMSVERFLRGYLKRRAILGFALSLLLIWIITSPARGAVSGWWFDVLIVAILIAINYGYGIAIQRLRGWILRQTIGPPAFGDADGPGKQVLRATFRAAEDVHLTFSNEDEKVMTRLAKLDVAVTPLMLRHCFMEARKEAGVAEAERVHEWDATWQRVQNHLVDRVTYDELRRSHPYALLTIPLWLISSLAATAALDIFMLVIVWLGYRGATGSGSVLPIVEVIVLFSLITSGWVLINRAYRAREIPIGLPGREQLIEFGVDDEALLSEADQLQGKVVRPVDVRLGPRYFHELVALSTRALAVDCGARILMLAILAGISLTAALIFRGNGVALADAYQRLLLVIVIAPLALLLGHYLASVAMQNSRKVIATLASALIGAAFPLLGEYVLTGSIGESPGTLATSLVLGMFGVIAAVLAKMVEARFEARPTTP